MNERASSSMVSLQSEERYYGIALRLSAATALLIVIGAFLFMPREFVVKPYQLRRSVEMVMEALPAALQEMQEQPQAPKPTSVPVAAANEAEVEATTIQSTELREVVARTEETDIPIVAFWKVEVKPQPTNIPVPDYPPMARNAGIEGQTLVEALVDIDGSIREARVLKSSGNSSLDQAAVSAARNARFTPAKQRDQPVRVWVSIPFRFSLQ
jgi:periplasmic protein TonB